MDDDIYKENNEVTEVNLRSKTADLEKFSENFEDPNQPFYQNFVPKLQLIRDLLESDDKLGVIDYLDATLRDLHSFFKDYEIPKSQIILESHIIFYLTDILENSPADALSLRCSALSVCCDLSRGDKVYSKEFMNLQILDTIFLSLKGTSSEILIRNALVFLTNLIYSLDDIKNLISDRDILFLLDLLSKTTNPKQIRYFTNFLKAYTKGRDFKKSILLENIKHALNYIIDSGEAPNEVGDILSNLLKSNNFNNENVMQLHILDWFETVHDEHPFTFLNVVSILAHVLDSNTLTSLNIPIEYILSKIDFEDDDLLQKSICTLSVVITKMPKILQDDFVLQLINQIPERVNDMNFDLKNNAVDLCLNIINFADRSSYESINFVPVLEMLNEFIDEGLDPNDFVKCIGTILNIDDFFDPLHNQLPLSDSFSKVIATTSQCIDSFDESRESDEFYKRFINHE